MMGQHHREHHRESWGKGGGQARSRGEPPPPQLAVKNWGVEAGGRGEDWRVGGRGGFGGWRGGEGLGLGEGGILDLELGADVRARQTPAEEPDGVPDK